MAGEIEFLPNRSLATVVGADADGLAGKSVAVARILAASAVPLTCPANTAENILATISITGGTLGPNGQVEVICLWTSTNNANSKTGRVRLGGVTGAVFGTEVMTTSVSLMAIRKFANRNSEASQIGGQAGATGGIVASGAAFTTAVIDTSAAQDLVITGQLANSADLLRLEAYSVMLQRPAE